MGGDTGMTIPLTKVIAYANAMKSQSIIVCPCCMNEIILQVIPEWQQEGFESKKVQKILLDKPCKKA